MEEALQPLKNKNSRSEKYVKLGTAFISSLGTYFYSRNFKNYFIKTWKWLV